MHARARDWILPAVGVVALLIGLWVLAASEHSVVAWKRGMACPGGDVRVLGTHASPGAAQDGQRVLVTGMPKVVQPPRDRDFGVQADSPLLVRKVAMFQWHEVRVGGRVSYQQDWIGHAVDSSRFDQPAGHANTQPFPFATKRFQAPEVRLDGFVLAPAIEHALPGALVPVKPDFGQLPANLQASFEARNGVLTTSADLGWPRLGDLRVRWLALPLHAVTVVARIQGDQLVSAAGPGAGFRVQLGARSLTDVFPDLPPVPRAVWPRRALALVLAWLGAWLILRRWFAARSAVPTALASGIMLLGILAGVIWLAAGAAAAVIAWVIAVLAALGGWQSWRRLS